MSEKQHGVLYVVATPIGNLGDMGRRAVSVLQEVDLIAAEDTRKTALLLREFAINTPMRAYHEHNEAEEARRLLEAVARGERIALVSDAGTPLVSDPGYRLVQLLRAEGLSVVPVPGPCALIAALSASGMPSDRFLFAGFPPRTEAKRRAWLEELAGERGTLILYESSHRIRATLGDVCELFGQERRLVLARELTKLHETFLSGSACDIARMLDEDANQLKGEHVLLIEGCGHSDDKLSIETERLLAMLLQELPLKRAAALAAKISGGRKNDLYKLGLRMTAKD